MQSDQLADRRACGPPSLRRLDLSVDSVTETELIMGLPWCGSGHQNDHIKPGARADHRVSSGQPFRRGADLMLSNFDRYERIAPLYDLLDLPFERRRYQSLRPLIFQNLGGGYSM